MIYSLGERHVEFALPLDVKYLFPLVPGRALQESSS